MEDRLTRLRAAVHDQSIAALGKAEVAFRALLGRFPELQGTEDAPTRGGTFMLRGLERFVVVG